MGWCYVAGFRVADPALTRQGFVVGVLLCQLLERGIAACVVFLTTMEVQRGSQDIEAAMRPPSGGIYIYGQANQSNRVQSQSNRAARPGLCCPLPPVLVCGWRRWYGSGCGVGASHHILALVLAKGEDLADGATYVVAAP